MHILSFVYINNFTCFLPQNVKLTALAEKAQSESLEAEMDILWRTPDKAIKYEATIEIYVKKLEHICKSHNFWCS